LKFVTMKGYMMTDAFPQRLMNKHVGVKICKLAFSA